MVGGLQDFSVSPSPFLGLIGIKLSWTWLGLGLFFESFLLGRRLIVPKEWGEFEKLYKKAIETGKFANIGAFPFPEYVPQREYKNWYMSSDTVSGDYPFAGHLYNKKWPLQKVM